MSFCYRRMTLFSCKCKLMLMVMVNKRRTPVLLFAWNCKGWVWCLVFGVRPLKEQNIQYASIPFFTRKEKMKCFDSTWIKNAIVYNILLVVYFKVLGYRWMNYYKEIVYNGCPSGKGFNQKIWIQWLLCNCKAIVRRQKASVFVNPEVHRSFVNGVVWGDWLGCQGNWGCPDL